MKVFVIAISSADGTAMNKAYTDKEKAKSLTDSLIDTYIKDGYDLTEDTTEWIDGCLRRAGLSGDFDSVYIELFELDLEN